MRKRKIFYFWSPASNTLKRLIFGVNKCMVTASNISCYDTIYQSFIYSHYKISNSSVECFWFFCRFFFLQPKQNFHFLIKKIRIKWWGVKILLYTKKSCLRNDTLTIQKIKCCWSIPPWSVGIFYGTSTCWQLAGQDISLRFSWKPRLLLNHHSIHWIGYVKSGKSWLLFIKTDSFSLF